MFKMTWSSGSSTGLSKAQLNAILSRLSDAENRLALLESSETSAYMFASASNTAFKIDNDETTYFKFYKLGSKKFAIDYKIISGVPFYLAAGQKWKLLADNQITFEGINEPITLITDTTNKYSLIIGTTGEFQLITTDRVGGTIPAGATLSGKTTYTLGDEQSFTIGSAAIKIPSDTHPITGYALSPLNSEKFTINSDETTYFHFVPLTDKQFLIRFRIYASYNTCSTLQNGWENLLSDNQITFAGITSEIPLYGYLGMTGEHCRMRINTDGNIQIGEDGEWSIKLEGDDLFTAHGFLKYQCIYSLEDGQSYTIGSAATAFTDYSFLIKPTIINPVLETVDADNNLYTLSLPAKSGTLATINDIGNVDNQLEVYALSSSDSKFQIDNDDNTYFEFIPLSDNQFFIRFRIIPRAFISSGMNSFLTENQITFHGLSNELLLFYYNDEVVRYSLRINSQGEIQIGMPSLCVIVPAVPLIGQVLYTLDAGAYYVINSSATRKNNSKSRAEYFTDYALMSRPLIQNPVIQTTDTDQNIYTLLLPKQTDSTLATTTSQQVLTNKTITNPRINGRSPIPSTMATPSITFSIMYDTSSSKWCYSYTHTLEKSETQTDEFDTLMYLRIYVASSETGSDENLDFDEVIEKSLSEDSGVVDFSDNIQTAISNGWHTTLRCIVKSSSSFEWAEGVPKQFMFDNTKTETGYGATWETTDWQLGPAITANYNSSSGFRISLPPRGGVLALESSLETNSNLINYVKSHITKLTKLFPSLATFTLKKDTSDDNPDSEHTDYCYVRVLEEGVSNSTVRQILNMLHINPEHYIYCINRALDEVDDIIPTQVADRIDEFLEGLAGFNLANKKIPVGDVRLVDTSSVQTIHAKTFQQCLLDEATLKDNYLRYSGNEAKKIMFPSMGELTEYEVVATDTQQVLKNKKIDAENGCTVHGQIEVDGEGDNALSYVKVFYGRLDEEKGSWMRFPLGAEYGSPVYLLATDLKQTMSNKIFDGKTCHFAGSKRTPSDDETDYLLYNYYDDESGEERYMHFPFGSGADVYLVGTNTQQTLKNKIIDVAGDNCCIISGSIDVAGSGNNSLSYMNVPFENSTEHKASWIRFPLSSEYYSTVHLVSVEAPQTITNKVLLNCQLANRQTGLLTAAANRAFITGGDLISTTGETITFPNAGKLATTDYVDDALEDAENKYVLPDQEVELTNKTLIAPIITDPTIKMSSPITVIKKTDDEIPDEEITNPTVDFTLKLDNDGTTLMVKHNIENNTNNWNLRHLVFVQNQRIYDVAHPTENEYRQVLMTNPDWANVELTDIYVVLQHKETTIWGVGFLTDSYIDSTTRPQISSLFGDNKVEELNLSIGTHGTDAIGSYIPPDLMVSLTLDSTGKNLTVIPVFTQNIQKWSFIEFSVNNNGQGYSLLQDFENNNNTSTISGDEYDWINQTVEVCIRIRRGSRNDVLHSSWNCPPLTAGETETLLFNHFTGGLQWLGDATDTNPQPEIEAAEYPSGEINISMTQGTNNDWDTITIDSKITTRTGEWEIQTMSVSQSSPFITQGTWLDPQTNLYDAFKYYAHSIFSIPPSNFTGIYITVKPLNTPTTITITVRRVLNGELGKITINLDALFADTNYEATTITFPTTTTEWTDATVYEEKIIQKTLTLPLEGTVATIDSEQTLENKTLLNPIIIDPSISVKSITDSSTVYNQVIIQEKGGTLATLDDIEPLAKQSDLLTTVRNVADIGADLASISSAVVSLVSDISDIADFGLGTIGGTVGGTVAGGGLGSIISGVVSKALSSDDDDDDQNAIKKALRPYAKTSYVEDNYLTKTAASANYATISTEQTLTNKTFDAPTINDPSIKMPETITTTEPVLDDNGDPVLDPETGEAQTTTTTSTISHAVILPALGGTLATLDGEETLTNKTLTDPSIKVNETITTTEPVLDDNGDPVLDPETGEQQTTTTTSTVSHDIILPATGGILATTEYVRTIATSLQQAISPTVPVGNFVEIHLYNLSHLLNTVANENTFFVKVYEGKGVAEITATYTTSTSTTNIMTAGAFYTDADSDHCVYCEAYTSNSKPYLCIRNSSTSENFLYSGTTSNFQFHIHGYIYGFSNLTISTSAVQLF